MNSEVWILLSLPRIIWNGWGFVPWYTPYKRCFGVEKSLGKTWKQVKTIWWKFWTKKIFDFFWAQKFRRNVISYPPKMDFLQLQGDVKFFLKSAMKTNKNSCESWDIGLSNAPTFMSIRLLEKKCGAFFEKKRFPVYPLE